MDNQKLCRTTAIKEHSTRLLEQIVGILRTCSLSDEAICGALKIALESPQQDLGEVRQLDATWDFHVSSCEIVYRWRHDPEFLDRAGLPLRLPVRGATKSFSALASSWSLGTPDQYLSYLRELGAIADTDDGLVELRMDSVMACSGRSGRSVSAETVLLHVTDFLSTVRSNLESRGAFTGGLFERACVERIPSNYLPILQRLIDERGQNFIDGIDEWLARHNVKDTAGQSGALVGVGAYMYVRSGNE
jgi:hypothetical protein